MVNKILTGKFNTPGVSVNVSKSSKPSKVGKGDTLSNIVCDENGPTNRYSFDRFVIGCANKVEYDSYFECGYIE